MNLTLSPLITAIERLRPFHVSLDEHTDTANEAGVGSFGTVYKSRLNGANCAVKKIHEILTGFGGNIPVATDDWGTLMEKFTREIELLSRLRHPNIVQFLGVTGFSGDPRNISLVMEYVDISLETFIKRRKDKDRPLSIKVSILKDTANGVSHLHSQGIVHRDLNSGNVLISSSGFGAKVADLGIARVINKVGSPMTCAPGAADYMPPEACADAPIYSFKLDCFSFGHLALYTLVEIYPTPVDPFPGERPDYYHDYQIFKRRRSFQQLGNEHPLVEIVQSCLKDNPDDRRDMKYLRAELDRVLLTHQFKIPSVVEYMEQQQKYELEIQKIQGDLELDQINKHHFEITIQERDQKIDMLEKQVQKIQGELDQNNEHHLEMTQKRDQKIDMLEKQIQKIQGELDQINKHHLEITQKRDQKIDMLENQVDSLTDSLGKSLEIIGQIKSLKDTLVNAQEVTDMVLVEHSRVLLPAPSLLGDILPVNEEQNLSYEKKPISAHHTESHVPVTAVGSNNQQHMQEVKSSPSGIPLLHSNPISVVSPHHTENQIPVTAIDSNNQQHMQEVKSSPSGISPLHNDPIPDSVAQINKQHDVHENYPIESQNNPPVIMRKPPSRRNKEVDRTTTQSLVLLESMSARSTQMISPRRHTENQILVTAIDSASNNQQHICKRLNQLSPSGISPLHNNPISVIPHHHTENQIPVTAIDSASNNQQEVKSSPSSISPLYNNQSPISVVPPHHTENQIPVAEQHMQEVKLHPSGISPLHNDPSAATVTRPRPGRGSFRKRFEEAALRTTTNTDEKDKRDSELKTLTLGRSFKQNFELYAFKSQLSGKLSADNGANASENN